MRLTLLLTVLAAFTAFTAFVTVENGYTGFLTLAAREPWALQMLIDLFIMGAFICLWMLRDAKERGITAWPFILATCTLGSLGVLGYMVRRELTFSATGARAIER